jgi:hypothetical protein
MAKTAGSTPTVVSVYTVEINGELAYTGDTYSDAKDWRRKHARGEPSAWITRVDVDKSPS